MSRMLGKMYHPERRLSLKIKQKFCEKFASLFLRRVFIDPPSQESVFSVPRGFSDTSKKFISHDLDCFNVSFASSSPNGTCICDNRY